MYSLKQYEIDEINKWLMLDDVLDDEIFNEVFINLGNDIEKIYQEYLDIEYSFDESVRSEIVSLEEFIKATELKLEDRFYSEVNRYVKFSDGCIYYINDNTLLG